MKRILSLFAAAALAASLTAAAAAADGVPATLSEAYVVMDADSGQVILEKNGSRAEYPASITKVLTVAIVLEGHEPEEPFVLGDEVLDIDAGSTHVALVPGEQVTVEQMCYAAMLPSANDAANGLAVYDAGSMEAFVAKMNEKARQLGASDTHFQNPSGLHDPSHKTTARDFALITRWAMTVPNFMTYFGADAYTMPPTNRQAAPRSWGTDNCLTVESSYLYRGATGGKLGYTPEAHHTLAASAGRDGLNVVIVALNSQSKWDKFKDAVALLDYAFGSFERGVYDVPGLKETPRVPYYEDGKKVGEVLFELPEKVPFVVRKGEAAGELRARLDVPDGYSKGDLIDPKLIVTCDGAPVYTESLSYSIDIRAVEADAQEKPLKEGERTALEVVVKILLGLIGVAVLLFIALMIWANWMRRRRRRRRTERYRRMERGNYQRRH